MTAPYLDSVLARLERYCDKQAMQARPFVVQTLIGRKLLDPMAYPTHANVYLWSIGLKKEDKEYNLATGATLAEACDAASKVLDELEKATR